jgi:hypothetical protein
MLFSNAKTKPPDCGLGSFSLVERRFFLRGSLEITRLSS